MQRGSYCLHLPCYLLFRSITTFRGPTSSIVRHICDARVCSNRTATGSNPNGIRTRVNQAQMAELDLLTGKSGNTRVSSRARGKSRARALHTDARMRVAGWIILLSHLHYVELCFAEVSSANHTFERTEFG